jgi:CRISPR-associated protein Csm1
MPGYEVSRAAWLAQLPPDTSIPLWPSTGIAIEGDFSGIQRFVLRPVPGAKGAARRLRARSFRVLALTRLVASAVEERFRDAGARLFYCAGGRFVFALNACNGWGDRLADLQRELDEDLLRNYRGELVFHLAGAEFSDGRIPVEALGREMSSRSQRPMSYVLQAPSGWATGAFAVPAGQHEKCGGCGATAPIADRRDQETLCQTCVDDRELGGALQRGRTKLKKSPSGSLHLLGQRWAVSPDGEIEVPLLTHAPIDRRGELLSFEDLCKKAAGRPYLAYLRMDADRVGIQFSKLDGRPGGIWGLSTLLDGAFSSEIGSLIRSRYPNIYPVYGGGDDLFVIGPWNEILGFAAAWYKTFREISGGKLTFSAGIALAKPRQHILSKSEQAKDALDGEAKKNRNSIHALGCTIPWPQFDAVLDAASQLAQFHANKQIKSAMLYNILELHHRWLKDDARWHSLLFYQMERNSVGDAKDFIRSKFLSGGFVWKYADFAVRYAMLRSRAEEDKQHDGNGRENGGRGSQGVSSGAFRQSRRWHAGAARSLRKPVPERIP